MILEVYVDEQAVQIEIPENVLKDAGDFFDKMDQDMDKGWKMGPTYVENPDPMQRAQIVADKLLTGLENENKNLTFLMAGYIVTRLPGVQAVRIDPNGEPLNTEIIF
jgi:hypothetical protein